MYADVHCTAYIARFTVYGVQCTPYSIRYVHGGIRIGCLCASREPQRCKGTSEVAITGEFGVYWSLYINVLEFVSIVIEGPYKATLSVYDRGNAYITIRYRVTRCGE